MKRRRDPFFWASVGYMVLLVLFAIIWPMIGYRYDQVAGQPYMPWSSKFWLGTDELGRDVVVRLARRQVKNIPPPIAATITASANAINLNFSAAKSAIS